MKTPPPVSSRDVPAFLQRPRVEPRHPTSFVPSLLASCLGLRHLPQSPREVGNTVGLRGIDSQSSHGQHPAVPEYKPRYASGRLSPLPEVADEG